jgi:hypothetical protein
MPESSNKGGRKPRVTDKDLLDVFRSTTDPVLSTAEVADDVPIKRRGVLNRLRSLEDTGDLESKQIGGRNTVWWIPAPGERASDAVDVPTDGPPDPPADAHGADAAGEEDALDDVLADLPSTVDADAARETIHTARDYLRTHGPAPKAAIVRDVMPDHPLGYDVDAALEKFDAGDRYRGAWWRRVVKPGLEALPDVSKPPRGASDWDAGEDVDGATGGA